MSWDPTTTNDLLDCPRSSYKWAALGYRAGYRDGRDDVLCAIGEAGQTVAGPAAAIVRTKSFADVLRDREPDFMPCPAKCRVCSRCVAYEARWRRGGRDFLGLEQEAALAAREAA